MKKPKGYILDGAHVLCVSKPDKKTVQALRKLIALAKNIDAKVTRIIQK